MMGHKYTCSQCHRDFESDLSTEETAAETLSEFGRDPRQHPQEFAVVCHVCYLAMIAEYPPAQFLEDECRARHYKN
jgi:hypothetical protein